LFGACAFYGYDASAHLTEETLQASEVVANGLWISTFSAWFLFVTRLIVILFYLQDFKDIISATYANNWSEYLAQVVARKGAVAILSMLWVDSACAMTSSLLSAQRVTYAISRDHVLPFSTFFRKLSKRKMAVNAAWLIYFISVAITCAVTCSIVAFSAITATATIATNASYLFLFPIAARHTTDRKTFVPAKWNLGRFLLLLAVVASVCLH
jgi:amino acid transporter